MVHAAGAQPRRAALSGVDATLAALADPGRRAVIELLRAGPRRSSDIARALATSRPATSRTLRVLRLAGLVTETPTGEDGRAREYRLEPAAFKELRGWLDEVQGFWDDQLQSFKAHAERASEREP